MRAVLRLLALALAFTIPLAYAAPVLALDADEEEASVYPDDWPRVNKLAAGMNNVITWPADPVMFSIEGDQIFSDFWYPEVTGRMMGAVTGLLVAPWRLITGLFDVVTSPLATVMPMVSPEPFFTLIPSLHDDE